MKKCLISALNQILADTSSTEDIDEVTAQTICYWIEHGANDPEAKEMMENLDNLNAIPSKYRKIPQKTLYRGTDLSKEQFGKGITTSYDSWTTSVDLAKTWGTGLTLVYKPSSNDIVVDIEKIIPAIFDLFPDMECEYYNENEIVLKPVKLTLQNILE